MATEVHFWKSATEKASVIVTCRSLCTATSALATLKLRVAMRDLADALRVEKDRNDQKVSEVS